LFTSVIFLDFATFLKALKQISPAEPTFRKSMKTKK